MAEYFYYQILSTTDFATLDGPLRRVIEYFLGETLGADELKISTTNRVYEFSHERRPLDNVAPVLNPHELSDRAAFLLQQLNRASNTLFHTNQFPVPNLFPLHTQLTNTESLGDNEGQIFEFGFQLDVHPKRKIAIFDSFVSLLLDKYGRLKALRTNWSPVVSRHVASAVSESDLSKSTRLDEESGGTGPLVKPDFFYRENPSDLLVPGVIFLSTTGKYAPAIKLNQLQSDPQHTLSSFDYQDGDVIRSVEQLDYRTLAQLDALGVSVEKLQGNIETMNGLAECMEALDVANLLHLNSEEYGLGKTHQYAGFEFRISDDKNSDHGEAEIKTERYGLKISVRMGEFSHVVGLHYQDYLNPENDFSIERTYETQGLYEDSARDDEVARADNFPESQGIVVLEYLGENQPISIFGYDTSDLGIEEQNIMIEDARRQLDSDQFAVIDSMEFDAFLEESRIPQVDSFTNARLGITASMVHAPPADILLAKQGLYGKRNTSKLVGETGELSFRARNLWLNQDLNEVPWVNRAGNQMTNNHPIWDVRGTIFGNDKLVQVKTSRSANVTTRFNTYKSGLWDIMGGLKNNRRATLFQLIAAQDFANSGLTDVEIQAEAKRQGVLAINDGDIPAFREYTEARIRSDLPRYRDYFNAVLDGESVEIGQSRFSNMADVENHPNPLVRERVLAVLIDRVKKKITGNGVSTVGNRAQADFHVGLLARHRPAQIDTMMQVAPEAGMIQRLGANRASIQNGLKGGAAGVITGAGFSLISQGFSPGSIEFDRVGVEATAAGAGEALGTGISTRIVPYPTLVTRYGIGGAIGGRIVGGGIAGAISAPIVELGTMVYDDVITNKVDYQPHEYTGRVGSEAVGGVIVGATSAAAAGGATAIITSTALAGTALGTTVPIIGNVAGFAVGLVVGVAAYLAYSYFFKEDVNQTIKLTHLEIADELYTLEGNWDVKDYGFFQTARTRLPGGDDYAVALTGERITFLNPVDGTENVFARVEAIGDKARELFGPDRQLDIVDARIVKPLD